VGDGALVHVGSHPDLSLPRRLWEIGEVELCSFPG